MCQMARTGVRFKGKPKSHLANIVGVLYIDRKDVSVQLRDGALELRAGGERVRSVPARLLDRVVLRADTQLTSGTLAALAEAGVGLLALGGRGGQRVAHVLGAPSGDARARIVQCQRLGDDAWSLTWSRQIVRAKLRAQHRVLNRAFAERADLRKPLGDARGALLSIVDRLSRATERSSVLGLEGAGAAAYFKGFGHLFAPSLGFHGRRRRPPPDPVNACLSLGYTLLHARAVQACWAAGLDPMVGFLHLPSHGRASLACDLMEPWRALIDEWVWQQFRDRLLRPEHFGKDGAGACLMGKAARAQFYESLAPLERRYGTALRRHARQVARALSSAANLPGDVREAEDDSLTGSPANEWGDA